MDPHAFLSQALLTWEERRRNGEAAPAEQLCAGHPEMLDELRRRIRLLEIMDHQAGDNTPGAPSGLTHVVTQVDTVTKVHEGPLELSTRFSHLQQHGSGGLGEVFRATDLDLGRCVAIKFLRADFQTDPITRSQFLIEAEITGQLDHPGVVPVFGFGTKFGRPFYVMRFLSGGTLEAASAEYHTDGARSQSKLKTLIGHFRSACETIAYAHNRGIIHCDLKPGNILLGKYGETLVGDWGSALLVSRDAKARASGEQTIRPPSLSESSMSTSSSTRPWTPAYMSPEQIPDSLEPIGPASDIFSLGATLYQLLTGRNHLSELYLQKSKPTREEIFEWIRTGGASPPHKIKSSVPLPLEAICLKAMALKPDDRYLNALDMARDLEAWRTDGKVSVHKESVLDRALRSTRRHPQLAAASVVAGLLALLLMLASTAYFRNRAESETQRSAIAEKARKEVLRGSADSVAEMLAREIDIRWRLLEAMADDEQLQAYLIELDGRKVELSVQPPHAKLQAWLEQKKDRLFGELATSSLIVDAEGRLVARTPPPKTEKTFGQSFRYRDYFHGAGKDDPREPPSTRPAIRGPYRSIVYRSVSTGELLMTFTVPILADKPEAMKGKLLGVLGVSVEVSKFKSLQPSAAQRLQYSLVDFRPSAIDGQNYETLYVHHHEYDDQRRLGSKPPTLPGDMVAKLRQTFGPLLEAPRPPQAGDLEPAAPPRAVATEPLYEPAFVDPVPGTDPPAGAAFAPVVVTNRTDPAQRITQLVVIVQEADAKAGGSLKAFQKPPPATSHQQ